MSFVIGGKIMYGTAPLKAGDRRPTFEEAVEKKQVRWWGAERIPSLEAKKKIQVKKAREKLEKTAEEAVKPEAERKVAISFTKYARDKTDKQIQSLRDSYGGMELLEVHGDLDDEAMASLLESKKLMAKRIRTLVKLRNEQERLWIAAGSPAPVKRGGVRAAPVVVPVAAPVLVAPKRVPMAKRVPGTRTPGDVVEGEKASMADRIKIAKEILKLTDRIGFGETMLEVNNPPAAEAKKIREVIQKSKERIAELKKLQIATGGPVKVDDY